MSLHDPIGQDKEGNEISLIDVLKSENEDVIDTIQLNMELEKVKQYIDILDDREKEVIVGRFGLDLKKEKTQREIAKELGISRSYVSRIEKRALMKMFHEFYRAEKEKRKKAKGNNAEEAGSNMPAFSHSMLLLKLSKLMETEYTIEA